MNDPNSTSAAANPSKSEGQSANLAAGCSQDRFFHCNASKSTNVPQNSTFRKASRYRRRLNEPLSMGAHLSCAMRLGDSKKNSLVGGHEFAVDDISTLAALIRIGF